jgi:amidase
MASFDLEEASLDDAALAIRGGAVSAAELTAAYLSRIEQLDRGQDGVRSVLEVNREAMDIASALDAELARSGPRGPLHGIPVLLKDNIDTADSMHTSAGSLALMGSRPQRDAPCVRRLRAAGVVILGKANLSEWANFRSTTSTSGWSARGGQTRNPYVLDRTPCGSSSGSAAAVSANLVMAALGTETDGSVVCPSSVCGVVGIKPTLGLVSQSGVIPISHSQDVVGVHGRTVADAAALLEAIVEAGGGGSVAPQYRAALRPDALRDARIGVLRQHFCGYSPAADALFAEALRALTACGAVLHDPALLPSAGELTTSTAELTVLHHEFHAGLDAYLAARADPLVGSLADVIAFNRAHAEEEMPHFGQEHMEVAVEKGDLEDPEYRAARAECLRLSRTDGLDAVLDGHHLDALVSLTAGPAWRIDETDDDHDSGASAPAAMAGYPAVTVPMGMVGGALPVGITFTGRPFSEAALLSLADAFERATNGRRPPRFLTTLAEGSPRPHG